MSDLFNEFKNIFSAIKEKQTEYDLINRSRQKERIKKAQQIFYIARLERLRRFILWIGEQMEGRVKEYIEETVTLALHVGYGQKYKFVVEFNYDKRDQREVSFYFDKSGTYLEPRKDTVGYGVVDIAAFAARIVIWYIDDDPERAPAIMLLDEPFKNLSAKYAPSVSEVVKQIADLMDIQFIISTHIPELKECADNFLFIENLGEKG
jgi:hypothetical protein